MDLQARLEENLEGDYTQADAMLKKKIPDFAEEIVLNYPTTTNIGGHSKL